MISFLQFSLFKSHLEKGLFDYCTKIIEIELFEGSAEYDRLPTSSIRGQLIKNGYVFPSFSPLQIQVEILTARLLGQLSSNDFVICNEVLSKVANSSWSDNKKSYVIVHMWKSFGFGPFCLLRPTHAREVEASELSPSANRHMWESFGFTWE